MRLRARGRIALMFGMMVPACCLVAACAEVDAREDFHVTAELIKARTGSVAAFDPAADQAQASAAMAGLIEGGLTVDEAVAVALLGNPALQASYQEIGISRADLVAAGRPSNPLLFFSARFPEGGGGMLNLTTALTQSLFEMLLIPSRERLGEANLEATRLAVARQAVELAGEVKRTAYQLLAERRAMGVALEHLELTRRSLGIAERRLAAGEGDVLEVNLARAAVLDVKREALVARRDARLRRVALARLMGILGREGAWTLTGDMLEPGALASLKELERLAQVQRLDVQVARLRIVAADELAESQGLFWARDLQVGVERERSDSPPSLTGPTLQVGLPVWHQNQPAAARAAFRAVGARRHLADVMAGALRDVRQAWTAADASSELVRLFNDEILPHARSSLASAIRAWQSGQHDILVVIEAQGSLLAQRRAYLDALREYASTLADLEQAAGGRLAPGGQKTNEPGHERD